MEKKGESKRLFLSLFIAIILCVGMISFSYASSAGSAGGSDSILVTVWDGVVSFFKYIFGGITGFAIGGEDGYYYYSGGEPPEPPGANPKNPGNKGKVGDPKGPGQVGVALSNEDSYVSMWAESGEAWMEYEGSWIIIPELSDWVDEPFYISPASNPVALTDLECLEDLAPGATCNIDFDYLYPVGDLCTTYNLRYRIQGVFGYFEDCGSYVCDFTTIITCGEGDYAEYPYTIPTNLVEDRCGTGAVSGCQACAFTYGIVNYTSPVYPMEIYDDEDCTDGIDNDCDGYTDCADSNCTGQQGPDNSWCCESASDCEGDQDYDEDCNTPTCNNNVCEYPEIDANVKDEDGSYTCAYTCQACDGYGNCDYAQEGTDDYDECDAYDCYAGYCDGNGNCGIVDSGDGFCEACGYCDGSSGNCQDYEYGTQDTTGPETCDGFCEACANGCTLVNGIDPADDCTDSSCSETYTEYCEVGGKRLVEYEGYVDGVIDTFTLTDSCENTCTGQSSPYCTDCSTFCGPYDTSTSCVAGLCGAECDSTSTWSDYCSADERRYDGTCGSITCEWSYSTEDCNDYDGWVDTGNTQWISTGECTEKEQKEQKYRDYTCSSSTVQCNYSVTGAQWVDTNETRNKADGTACGDSSDTVCDNPDTCSAGVCVDNYEPATHECRPAAGPCDIAEYCDGAGNCPTDEYETSGDGSGASGYCDVCTECDGSGPYCVNVGANLQDTQGPHQCWYGHTGQICSACDGNGNCGYADAGYDPGDECPSAPGEGEYCSGTGYTCGEDTGDSDGDGVPDSEDKCPDTVIPEGVPTDALRPNHYAQMDGDMYFETNTGSASNPYITDSSYSIVDTYGCSCEQILYCKPGANNGEEKWGCTAGTMNVWTNQIGWSLDCQVNGIVALEGEAKPLLEDTDDAGMIDLLDGDNDNDGIPDGEDSEDDSKPTEPGLPGTGKPDWWCDKHPGKC